MNPVNYKQTIDDLHRTPRRPKDDNLHRMERLLHHLGNPHEGLSIIHIAGTNGKGSVAKMLYKSLSEAGYKTGLFTSPYIFDFRERIICGARMIPEGAVVELYQSIREAGRRVEEEGYGYPSEFELVTAMALVHFQQEAADPVIVEVGIGGLWDATNVVTPILSLITSINYDHMNLLGDSLESIARHKAGIIKKAPAIAYFQYPEAEAALRRRATDTGASLAFIQPRDMGFLEHSALGQRLRYHPPGKAPLDVHLALLGVHQIQNLNLALRALELLATLGYEVGEVAIQRALPKVRWPGRMEVLSTDPLIVIDGAHNQDGAASLRESLDFYYPGRNILLILGMLKDKDVRKVASILARNVKKTYCITPGDVRGLPAEELAEVLRGHTPAETAPNSETAVRRALKDRKEDDLILIAGSLYLISDMEHAVDTVLHETP